MSSSSSAISPVAAPPWAELPRELTAAILRKLGAFEILATALKVCKPWWRVCQDPAMWRRINIRRHSVVGSKTPLDMEKMCRRAVDLSQGQLTHITIHGFGSDSLLLYIAQRSSQLKSLEFVSVSGITSGGLSEALKSLELLEEVHLYYTFVGKEDIENIGRSCPLLTSFKFNNRWVCVDEAALAIARNMPQLCHLQLIGGSITNEGLLAILDGCPRLESLDLRKCLDVRIDGDLERLLCSRGIKDLRLPNDPMDDYPFADLDNFDSFNYDIENYDYCQYLEDNGMDSSLDFLSHSEEGGLNLDSVSEEDIDILFPFFKNY